MDATRAFAGQIPNTLNACSCPAMRWQASSFRSVASSCSTGCKRGSSLSGKRLASRRMLMIEHGVQAPSSSEPHPAPGAPISILGTSFRASVARRPSVMSCGHASPGKQLQNFAKCGRGSLPKAFAEHLIEEFTCRTMAESPVQVWRTAVPTQTQVPASNAHKCLSVCGRSCASQPKSWRGGGSRLSNNCIGLTATTGTALFLRSNPCPADWSALPCKMAMPTASTISATAAAISRR
mmetsp:Transcript_126104/g.251820  ORF Transcript_126104/g.251820 Transcript_126104/m.251820 type:complete len:237 (+) Transcript_126104:405-1115(+)